MKKKYRSLILNADFMPLNIKSWEYAFVLIMKEKANQIDFYQNDYIKDGHGRQYPIPAVVALNTYVHRDYKKAPFNKQNVKARDHYKCQYCNREFKAQNLTLDHVIPRSKWNGKGSPTCWTNIVTACFRCNSKKADKSCEASGMFPINYPVQPGYDEIFFGLHFHGKIEKEWMKWLSVFSSFKEDGVYCGKTTVHTR